MSESGAFVRIFREGWGIWWAELLVLRKANSPFPPMRRDDWPDFPPGYTCAGTAMRYTRGGARRAGAEILQRYQAEQHPTINKPEIVETLHITQEGLIRTTPIQGKGADQ